MIVGDQLHQMNSALNKQLQRLGQLDHISSISTLKPVNPLKFSMISQSTDSTQAASHFPSTSIQDPLNYPQYSLPLSSIDYQGFSIEDATSKGLKMQRELIKLHSKVLSLEKKMTLIDTRTPPKKKSARKPTRASLDPQDSATIQFTNFTSLSITPRSPKRLFNKVTPKNNKHNMSLVSQKSPQKGFHDRRASLPKQSLPTSKFASPRQEETRIQQRRASLHVKPTKKQEQQQVEQERIENRRASLQVKPARKEQQPEQEKTRRKYNVIDNSRIMEGDSMILGRVTEVQSPMRIETLEYREYRGYQHDVYILNNQMNQLNKEYEQDKQALKLEKKKGKELESEIKKAGKKMETLGKRIGKVQMLGEDYEGLLGSFKRSEEIRNKQRDMIGNLNYEIILLKAEKENLNTGDKSIREKKRKTSVKKRATSQKKIGAKGI